MLSITEVKETIVVFDIKINHRKPENDILSGLTDEQKREFRNAVIASVLATDLAHHMEITAQWNSLINKFTKDDKSHRMLLLQVLLKAADIGNPGKPFEIAKYWANMVQEEFFAQVSFSLRFAKKLIQI